MFNRGNILRLLAIVKNNRPAKPSTSQRSFELATPVLGNSRRAKQEHACALAKRLDSGGSARQNACAINDFVATVFGIYGNAPRSHGSKAAVARANFCSSCGTTVINTWPTTAKLRALSSSSVS